MLIVHLFVSYAHVNLCNFFSSSWCRGLAEAASACGSSWTCLFTFFLYLALYSYVVQPYFVVRRVSVKMENRLYQTFILRK